MSFTGPTRKCIVAREIPVVRTSFKKVLVSLYHNREGFPVCLAATVRRTRCGGSEGSESCPVRGVRRVRWAARGDMAKGRGASWGAIISGRR